MLSFVLLITACSKDEDKDTTPPDMVTDLSAIASTGQVVLNWTEPTDVDLDSIKISVTPSDEVFLVAAGLNSATISGLINGTAYTFSICTVDKEGNKSEPVTVTAVPNTSFTVISPDQDNYSPVAGTFSADGQGHLVMTLTFNRPVDPTSFVGGQNIYFEGDVITQGTCVFTNFNKTVTFTTTETTAEIGLYFSFILTANEDGSVSIKDENGMTLDGNENGISGGDYILSGLYIIG